MALMLLFQLLPHVSFDRHSIKKEIYLYTPHNLILQNPLYIKRGGKVWIKIFPDKPVTAQPAETRMALISVLKILSGETRYALAA